MAGDDADYFERLDAQLTGFVRLARDPRLHARMTAGTVGDSRLYLLLNLLHDYGAVRASELEDIMALDQSTISRQLAALAQRGFIERKVDPNDRRAASIVVTTAGRDAISLARAAWQKTLAEMMTDWSLEDRAALLVLLGRISSRLEPLVRCSTDAKEDTWPAR